MASTRFSFDLRANVGQFRRGFKQADQTVRGFGNRLGFLRSRVTQVGAALGAFFGGRALASGFQSIVGEAADLETAMSRIEAVSGATEQEMARLRATAIDMGENTTFTAVEAAGAMENLARAGLNASEQIETIPQVLQFAQANSLQLAEAASLVTSAVNGMGLEFSETQRVTDVLTKAAQNADANVQELGNALSFAAPTANALGLEIEQTTALIGTLADAGFEGSRAGTSLNNIFSQFTDTTSTFQRALQDANIENENFAQMLRELERGGPEAEKAINALGTEAGPALRQLLAVGTDSINSYREALQNAEGVTKSTSDIMTDNLEGAVDRLGSAWNTLKRELGDPILGRVTQGVKDLAQGILNFVDSENLTRLQDSLVNAWDRGRAALNRFLEDFDLSRAVRRAIDGIESITSGFGRMVSAAQAAGAAIRIVWNGINAAVATVLQILANGVQKVMAGIATMQEGLASLGLASEESARKARMHAEAMEATAKALRDHAQEAGGRAWQATRDLGSAMGDLTKSTNDNTNAQQRGGDAARDHADATDEQRASFEELRATTQGVQDVIDVAAIASEQAGDKAARAAEGIRTLDESFRSLLAARNADSGGESQSSSIETLDETMQGVADAAEQARDRIGETGDEAQESADEFGEAQNRNQQAAEGTADAVDGVGDSGDRAASKLGGAAAALGRMLGNARQGFADIGEGAAKAFDKIVERSTLTGRSVGNFLDNLAQRRDRLQRSVEQEQESLAQMKRRIESASGSTEDLAQIASMSVDQFQYLGEERLRPVRDAIADAQRRLESMRESATSTLQSLQEELLRTQGREEELAELRRERRRQDLQQQLSQAQAAGDQESISKLREALQTLDKIGEAERRQRRERQREREQERQEREREPETPDRDRPRVDAESRRESGGGRRDPSPFGGDGGGGSGFSRRVRIELDGPDDTATVDADEDQAERLIEQLNRAGRRTS